MGTLGRGLAASLVAGLVSPVLLLAGSPTTYAAEGDPVVIDHVEAAGNDDLLKMLVTMPTGADLDGVTVTVDGMEATASAESAEDSTTLVRRSTVLAIDTSNSMKGERFTAAKSAATQFLTDVPDDVYVGIVTFDGTVRTALEPTLDRAAAQRVVDGLDLHLGTFLYDGVIAATDLAGSSGQRNVLLLSDGADTSKTTLDEATDDIRATGVHVDAVSLDDTEKSQASLEAITRVGEGELIPSDPQALTEAFAAQAESLTGQVQVSVELPDEMTKEEALVVVTVPVGQQSHDAQVFAVVRTGTANDAAVSTSDDSSSVFDIPRAVMYGAVIAIGLGLLIVFVTVFSMSGGGPRTVEQRIAAYGTQPVAGSRKAESQGFNLEEMKGAAASMLHRNRGLEARIEARLEGAASALKAPEWLLLHGGIGLLGALVGLLFGNGSALTTLLGLLLGLLLPWLWLGRKRKKRQAAFNASLADTLQLIAGSLQAGMALAQALDSVVAEGNEPIAGEFKRVLIETRLGVPLDNALEGIAQRMESVDFAWVVMAIRIQREVGGNLAELLTTVAGTLRERDYLRRQVKTLAAEGVMSAYILVALPIAMLGYLLLVRRDYVMPLFTEAFGLMLCGVAAVLLGLGWLMMTRIVKVEV